MGRTWTTFSRFDLLAAGKLEASKKLHCSAVNVWKTATVEQTSVKQADEETTKACVIINLYGALKAHNHGLF